MEVEPFMQEATQVLLQLEDLRCQAPPLRQVSPSRGVGERACRCSCFISVRCCKYRINVFVCGSSQIFIVVFQLRRSAAMCLRAPDRPPPPCCNTAAPETPVSSLPCRDICVESRMPTETRESS